MSKHKIQLKRNLRRTILRGHPWVYKEALASLPKINKAELAQVFDMKNEFVAWAMLDPHSPLSLRIMSLEKSPPSFEFFQKRFLRAYELRKSVIPEKTNAYRLFNGEGDHLPGLVCDVYDSVAVLQFDGQGPSEFWDKAQIAEWIIHNTHLTTVVEKFRRHSEGGIQLLAGPACADVLTVSENGVLFKVDIVNGQKTGFFLDQRDNRKYVQNTNRDKTVLNLFSYTGGFSVYAGLGGAKKVASLDVSEGAIKLSEENWQLNGLDPKKHVSLCVDVFKYLEGDKEMWDHIIVDPPSMSHSEDQKERAVAKYTELFAAAAKRVKAQGQLSLSSCSSHISFADFYEITNEALSQARRRGQILRVAGQGPDHPFPHISHELRYLKFIHLALD